MGTKNSPRIENKENNIRLFLNDINTDPTLLSFDLFFSPCAMLSSDDVINPSLITNDPISMLASFEENSRNVIASPHIYLKNLGETMRDNLWLKFIKILTYIFSMENGEQWRIQSIDGLDAVFTSILNVKDGYTGIGDEKITITCIEDIDLTMFNLFEMYRKCVYDDNYKRQIIPNNLLKFDCCIKITDRRIIKYDAKAKNSALENLTPQSKDAEEKELSSFQSKAMGAMNAVRGGIEKANSALDSVKTPKHELTERYTELTDRKFDKPVIYLDFTNCIFDISPLNKTFENINPGETDNAWAKYSFSFKFGKVKMSSSTIEEMMLYEKFDEEERKNPGAGFDPTTEKLKLKDSSMESLISGGWDGALNSAKQYGQDYLDGAVEDAKSAMNNVANSVLGQAQGYDLSDNIYGQSNFISAFGKSVGDKLTEFADEGLEKLKGATVGKAKEFINTQKAKVQGAINNATSAIMGDGPTKSTSGQSKGKLENIGFKEDSNPHFDKLTGKEKVDTGISTKNSDTFETFNIYENAPSGPKQ